ncbi:MAG: hypothetical protein H6879_00235 [Rhodobiaceae bacterium]|nr:hypothetical protein [Rhodobiaceae bacterium]
MRQTAHFAGQQFDCTRLPVTMVREFWPARVTARRISACHVLGLVDEDERVQDPPPERPSGTIDRWRSSIRDWMVSAPSDR